MSTLTSILNFLKDHGAATVHQISHALDITPAGIRHHLKILINQNQVKRSTELYQHGPGRPAVQFELTDQLNPELLQKVLSSIISDLSRLNISPQQKLTLARCIAQNLVSPFDLSGPQSVRISRIIDHLQPLGFTIHWEATAGGPLIVIKKEPISTIISDNELSRLILTSLLELINKKSPG